MVAAAVVAGAVVAGGASYAASNRSAGAVRDASNSANGLSSAQYNQTRSDLAPYRSVGYGALSRLARLYGLPTPTAPNNAGNSADGLGNVQIGNATLPPGTTQTLTRSDKSGTYYDVFNHGVKIGTVRPGGRAGIFDSNGAQIPSLAADAASAPLDSGTGRPDMSVFTESPDYQFNLAEGQKAIDRSLASRGMALSGAGVKEGVRYASGMASNEFGNFYNRLAALAGIGQTATNTTAGLGANAAAVQSGNIMNAGNARASAYNDQGQTIGNTVNGLTSNYLLSQYLAKQPVA